MWPTPQETADLVTFTEEILNGKLHFFCNVGAIEGIHNIWRNTRKLLRGEGRKSSLKVAMMKSHQRHT